MGPGRQRFGCMLRVGVAALALTAMAACDDDDGGSPDDVLRIEGPAQVDPSFGGVEGRDP
ncbi:MAG: hypothetical protein AAGF73_06180 [Actinomycetota bacterium]